MLGRFELERMAVLEQLIRPADIVWDVGAHHGYVSLLAATRVGPGGWVYAFEPDTQNNRILRRHLRWNRVHNVHVENHAISSFTGIAQFGGGRSSMTRALGSGSQEVAVTTGTSLVHSGRVRPPTIAKIDVEGAESDVLEGALPVLPPTVILLISIHSPTADQQCVMQLRTRGFRLYASRELRQARLQRWTGDPDLLCVGPAYEDDGRIGRLCDRGAFIAD